MNMRITYIRNGRVYAERLWENVPRVDDNVLSEDGQSAFRVIRVEWPLTTAYAGMQPVNVYLA